MSRDQIQDSFYYVRAKYYEVYARPFMTFFAHITIVSLRRLEDSNLDTSFTSCQASYDIVIKMINNPHNTLTLLSETT